MFCNQFFKLHPDVFTVHGNTFILKPSCKSLVMRSVQWKVLNLVREQNVTPSYETLSSAKCREAVKELEGKRHGHKLQHEVHCKFLLVFLKIKWVPCSHSLIIVQSSRAEIVNEEKGKPIVSMGADCALLSWWGEGIRGFCPALHSDSGFKQRIISVICHWTGSQRGDLALLNRTVTWEINTNPCVN